MSVRPLRISRRGEWAARVEAMVSPKPCWVDACDEDDFACDMEPKCGCYFTVGSGGGIEEAMKSHFGSSNWPSLLW